MDENVSSCVWNDLQSLSTLFIYSYFKVLNILQRMVHWTFESRRYMPMPVAHQS